MAMVEGGGSVEAAMRQATSNKYFIVLRSANSGLPLVRVLPISLRRLLACGPKHTTVTTCYKHAGGAV